MNPILVIKLGGSTGTQMSRAYRDIAELSRNYRVVVVHGVSERMADLSHARQMPIEMLTSPGGHSSRYTPAPVRDLFVEASTQVNHDVVNSLASSNAYPTTMTNHIVVHGQRKTAIRARINGRTRVIRDDYSGRITHINIDPLLSKLADKQIPIVPPLADSDDGLLNVDGDRVAASIAGALSAQSLIILSNVRGLYRNFPDEDSFIPQINRTQLESALNWAQGRMKRKVLSAQQALESGVSEIIVSDGRISLPVSSALSGEGTHFTQ